jgi:hypothetical protein
MTTSYYSQTDLATRVLRDLGLVDARITPDGDDIGALSKRIGLDIGPSFGLFSMTDAEQLKPALNMTLRRMNAKPATGVVAEAEYF